MIHDEEHTAFFSDTFGYRKHLLTAKRVDRTVSGASVVGASVVLDGSSSTDADSDSLTYRWTGPFPEGNGVATGAKPSVTLPLGASKVTLVVNDGEAESAPVAVNVAVSDFAVALSQGSASLKRGQSTTLNVNITSKGGSFAWRSPGLSREMSAVTGVGAKRLIFAARTDGGFSVEHQFIMAIIPVARSMASDFIAHLGIVALVM